MGSEGSFHAMLLPGESAESVILLNPYTRSSGSCSSERLTNASETCHFQSAPNVNMNKSLLDLPVDHSKYRFDALSMWALRDLPYAPKIIGLWMPERIWMGQRVHMAMPTTDTGISHNHEQATRQ